MANYATTGHALKRESSAGHACRAISHKESDSLEHSRTDTPRGDHRRTVHTRQQTPVHTDQGRTFAPPAARSLLEMVRVDEGAEPRQCHPSWRDPLL
eukprot:1537243-Prymnesium_polylepis.2